MTRIFNLVRSSILGRILGGYALIAAMLGVGLVATDTKFTTLNSEFYDLLEHDVVLVGGIERLHELLITIQSSKRAYLLTGDREFLVRHMATRESVQEVMVRVRRQITESSDDKRDLDHFAHALQLYIDSADPEMALRDRVSRGEIPLTEVVVRVRHNSGFAIAEGARQTLIVMHDRALRSVNQQRQVVLAAGARSHRVTVLVMVLSLLVALAYGVVVSQDLGRALTGLRRSIEAMARGERIKSVARRDEIGEVTRSFDQMADRLDAAEEELLAKVTEQDITVGQLRETNNALAQAMRVKSDFLATMSHELRTPLNAVIGLSALLLDSPREALSPRARSSLETMRASGEHLLGLLNDILDLAKAEAGRMTLSPSRVQIVSVIEACIATVQPLTRAGAVEVLFEPPERPIVVVADPQKLRQVLLNLMANAVKFTDKGRVTVHLRREGMAVAIDVHDTGIGIADEDLQEIFVEFHQAGRGDTREYLGTGLGLSLSRKMARLMGGEISVRSTPGEGSTFTLTLPSTDEMMDLEEATT